MKFTVERSILLGFASALLVLLLVTGASWWNAARFRSTHSWVEHTREILSHLEQLQSDVLGMQASTRGFVLTGSDEVLLPFNSASVHLADSLARLRELLADSPAQLERLAQTEPLATQARDIMLERIAARRARGLDAASETAAYLEGQRVVEALRRGIGAMVTAERVLLNERIERANESGRLTVVTIAATTVLGLGVSFFATRLLQKHLKRRNEAEAALQGSLARAEDLYDNAPCGYHSLDESGTIVAMNRTALDWLGYTREEVVGRMKFTDLLTPSSVEGFRERFAAFRREGAVNGIEYEWRRKDGGTFDVLLNATAIYDGGGRYVASRATVFDVTKRKRAEGERDRFFILSRDLLCIASFDGYLKRINPSWEHTLGFTEKEFQSRPYFEFIHPEDREAMIREARKLAAGQESIAFENRFLCRDGSHRWLRWNARADPRRRLIYASAHDVTEQRTATERIHKLNVDLAHRAQELETANKELESFSYSVSHDLRAPLRHIDGFAGLLTKRAGGSLDAECQRYIATISRSAKQMGTLIDDLLAFSRINRAQLRIHPVRCNQLIAEVIANGRYASGTREIQWEIQTLPEVHADPSMLRQVWVNLIDNAVKYSTKSDPPRILIGSASSEEPTEHVFFVRDNGVGFDMTYADKLFGVFQRLHSPAEFEGTGIGLANVRRIVMRHGGRTWAEGEVGRGAAFYFSLPRTPPLAST